MPVSPLAAAMLSGQGGGNEASLLGLVDPSAVADVQLGQGLEQQGLSTAPASPMQAIARMAQAGAGRFLQQSAMSDLGKVYAGATDSMAKIFPPGTDIGNALRSSNPLVRLTAMQQASKAMLLGTAPETLGPGQQRYSGRNFVAENTNPQSDFGKLARDQSAATGQRATPLGAAAGLAGGQAAARAPYEAGGEVTVQTPTGPQSIPATAATRAAIQPGTGAPTPAVAVPPPEPKPTAEGATKDQGRVPGPTASTPGVPAQPTVGGKPLGNPAIEPAVAADTKEVATDRERALAGQADMANVRMIQDFMPKVKTGWSAETKLEAGRILKGIGVPDQQINDFLNTDVASGQILQKKFVELSSAAARTMGAREPGSVISMFAKAYPNLGTDPQAVSLQTNALYMDRLRAQHLAEQKTNYLNDSINGVQGTGKYRGLTGFNEQFNKSNPAEYYLHAAEAMSGRSEPWARIKSQNQQQQIINLIPSGTHFTAPDGKTYVKP